MLSRSLSLLLFFYLHASHSLPQPKVLFYVPNLSYSHVAFNGKIADLLARNGYNVTVLLARIDPTVQTKGAVKLARVRTVEVGFADNDTTLADTLWKNPGPYEDASLHNPRIALKLIRVSRILVRACRALLANFELIEELRAQHYTIGFSEQYDHCGMALMHLVGVRRTQWLSATAMWRMQAEESAGGHLVHTPLSYVPELLTPSSHRMGFGERVMNAIHAKLTDQAHRWLLLGEETRIWKEAGRAIGADSRNCSSTINASAAWSEAVSDKEVEEELDLLILSGRSDSVISYHSPLFDFPYPTHVGIHHAVGLTVGQLSRSASTDDTPSLSEEWRRWTDTRTTGYWLVTFGSIARTDEMPPHVWDSLLRAFSAFPHLDFMVKYERLPEDTNSVAKSIHPLGEDHPNVYLTRWLPQVPLLRHDKCKGIITHGGWSSVLEAVNYAKPMVLMPLFADHFKNARVVEEKGLAVLVDKLSISSATFTQALLTIETNNIYARSTQYSRLLLHQGPVSSEEVILHQLRISTTKGEEWRAKRAQLCTRQRRKQDDNSSSAIVKLVGALVVVLAIVSL